jgi:hypothetical protein
LVYSEEGRLSKEDIMIKALNHCIEIGPTYKKFSITVLGLPINEKIVGKLNQMNKQYVEYSDDIEMNIEVLKISVMAWDHDYDNEISKITISHRDSGISGIQFEYRYHLDESGDVDRFVYINDKVTGRH